MPDKRSFDPDHRMLYGAKLQPPEGYAFDAAVATTYSLDFVTALAVPVSLALFAAESPDELHPLTLLEGAERIAGRLFVFTDAGHIQADTQPASRLCSLFERTIVEAVAPDEGAFHPKMWALRFKALRPDEPAHLRLLILSRNLTRDRCWDIALALDGPVTRRPFASNRPVADFIRRLPDLAKTDVPEGCRTLIDAMAEDIRRADWQMPTPFESVEFAVNGLGGSQWRPTACSKLGVMSPFCDEQTLSDLATLATSEKPVLIGRSDELAPISPDTLGGFSRVAVLDETATTEDGEDPDPNEPQGLHAKAFVAERGWDTSVTIGSGNATRPALETGANVEIFATLTGKRSQVGSVADIFGEKGFGRLTRPFTPGEFAGPGAAQRMAEWRLDKGRRELCRTGIRLQCEGAEGSDGGTALWKLRLIPAKPLPLAGIGALRLWPITRGEAHAHEGLDAMRQGQPVELGAMALVDLTRFVAFQLADEETGLSLLFSTGLAVDGMPAERHAAILRSIISNKDAFFRYLRLLLSEIGDPFAAALAAQEGSGQGVWRVFDSEAPILEEMVRAFCQGGDQLKAVDRLISRLEETETGETDPVPPEFRDLWDAFRSALKDRGTAHDG